jgi:hypothetical protein
LRKRLGCGWYCCCPWKIRQGLTMMNKCDLLTV